MNFGYVCVHRMYEQPPASTDIPECMCADDTVWAGVGSRVSATATEERHVTRTRCC